MPVTSTPRFIPSLKQRVQLAELIKANSDKTIKEMVLLAGPAIDHRLNYNHVWHMINELGLPFKRIGNTGRVPTNRVLASAIAELYKKLGEAVPADVQALLGASDDE